MTDQQVERLDNAISRLSARPQCVEQRSSEQQNTIWRLQSKVGCLENEITELRRRAQ